MGRILSHIALSALILLSATGLTINMHFCQGELYDMAFVSPAADCCGVDTDVNICQQDQGIAEFHHCNDESIKIEAAHEYLVSGFSFNFEISHLFELFGTSSSIPESTDTEKSLTASISNNKKPPQEVVLSQIQSFLI